MINKDSQDYMAAQLLERENLLKLITELFVEPASSELDEGWNRALKVIRAFLDSQNKSLISKSVVVLRKSA